MDLAQVIRFSDYPKFNIARRIIDVVSLNIPIPQTVITPEYRQLQAFLADLKHLFEVIALAQKKAVNPTTENHQSHSNDRRRQEQKALHPARIFAKIGKKIPFQRRYLIVDFLDAGDAGRIG